jgi:hypothetical protein
LSCPNKASKQKKFFFYYVVFPLFQERKKNTVEAKSKKIVMTEELPVEVI